MDPNATWKMLCDALKEIDEDPDNTNERENAIQALYILAEWLYNGGFPPKID